MKQYGREDINYIKIDKDYDEIIREIRFDDKGLVPAIVQDINTKEVLMLAYMNEESILKTLIERKACYYSRSREELWIKGETSSNYQYVKGFYYDCDKDSILLLVKQEGVACHTGSYSCFYNEVISEKNSADSELDDNDLNERSLNEVSCCNEENVINELYELIKDRKNNPVENSYTNYLFEKGLDKILKKVGEEASEVIIGAKNKDKNELVYEVSDLIYHLLVLLINEEISLEDIEKELESRKK